MPRQILRVLFFEGCPNHPPVAEMARRAVRKLGADALVQEVEITDPAEAERLRFLGSPTVQVDGVDIEPDARTRTDFGFSCRVYGGASGLPDAALFKTALGGAPDRQTDGAMTRSGHCCPPSREAQAAVARERGTAALSASGAVLAAVFSSACCWLPLLLLAVGASAAGVSAFFERWRLPLVASAGLLLAVGFYAAYFRRSGCEDGCESTPPRAKRLTQATLWIATAIVLAFVLFPSYAGGLIRALEPRRAPAEGGQIVTTMPTSQSFRIEGMTCVGCAAHIEADLSKVPGVRAAKVDYGTKTAVVDSANPGLERAVVETVKSAGYTARPEQ